MNFPHWCNFNDWRKRQCCFIHFAFDWCTICTDQSDLSRVFSWYSDRESECITCFGKCSFWNRCAIVTRGNNTRTPKVAELTDIFVTCVPNELIGASKLPEIEISFFRSKETLSMNLTEESWTGVEKLVNDKVLAFVMTFPKSNFDDSNEIDFESSFPEISIDELLAHGPSNQKDGAGGSILFLPRNKIWVSVFNIWSCWAIIGILGIEKTNEGVQFSWRENFIIDKDNFFQFQNCLSFEHRLENFRN